MSLNEGALDDLHSEAEYLTTPSLTPASGTAIVNASDIGPEPKVDDPDLAMQQLADYDIEIKTITDNITAYHKADEVASVILAKESISQSDATYVEQNLGGLYEVVGGENSFTELPTKVNLVAVKDYVSNQRSLFETETMQSYATYLEKTTAAVESLRVVLLESVLPSVIAGLEILRKEALASLDIVAKSNKFYVYLDQPDSENPDQPRITSDLRRVRFTSLSYAKANGDSSIFIPVEILNSLGNHVNRKEVQILVKVVEYLLSYVAVDKDGSVSMGALAAKLRSLKGNDSQVMNLDCYYDLANFYANGSALQFYELVSGFIANSKTVQEVPKDIASLVKAVEEISDYHTLVASTRHITVVLEKLNLSAKAVLNAYRLNA